LVHRRTESLHPQGGKPDGARNVLLPRVAPSCRSPKARSLYSMCKEEVWPKLWPQLTPMGIVSRSRCSCCCCPNPNHSRRVGGSPPGCNRPDPITFLSQILSSNTITLESVVPCDV
jgi:hypothetical protein